MLKRSAGVLIPLFSISTDEDLGCGEIPALSAMVDLTLALGHRVIQLLPLNETAPAEASPYSALSLFAIDPIYVSAAQLDGVDPAAVEAARASARRRRMVGRARLHATKLALIDQAFHWFKRDAGGHRYRGALQAFAEHHREWLGDYALFRALKERLGFSSWETWPEELKRREPAALERARRELAEPIEKFCYFQFLAYRQWSAIRAEAARRGAMLGGDFAFAPARDSADVWAHQVLFDLERTVGTPPDAFSAQGQRWGLPMPNWARMRADGLRWWRMRARHAAELYDLFRVDHVVGLYRTFSFGPDPTQTGEFYPLYEWDQRSQGEDVIRAIKEEAGSSSVIAEDLGTVPPWIKDSLTALGVPGFKVFRWEKENWHTPHARFVTPSTYPELSVATTGTHDTETLAVWWRESDDHQRRQICEALGINELDPGRARLSGAMLEAILRTLYAAPSVLVLVPIQDLFGWSARINVPGTVGGRNWNYRLPLSLKPLQLTPAIRARVEHLRAMAVATGRFEE
jgi:4-alpha-glucanotransferase